MSADSVKTLRRPSRARSDGLRVTKVGLWYLAACAVVLAAATNTGNNGLFLVVAMLFAAFLVSHLVAVANLRSLTVELSPDAEIFANRPAHLDLSIRARGRLLPHWLLIVTVDPEDIEPPIDAPQRRTSPMLVPRLDADGEHRGQLEVLVRRRGARVLRRVRVTSLFPFGFFQKGRRLPADAEILVYPELFDAASAQPARTGKAGEESVRRAGHGHGLYALREFRQGDDPRGIHWKQTARQRRLIYQQRETEESRRLMIVFDNAVGELAEKRDRKRFERLVSEAATAAVDHLDAGFDVSLVTREEHLPFAGGPRQRHSILEALALVEPVPRDAIPLGAPGPNTPHLLLSMDPMAEPGAAA